MVMTVFKMLTVRLRSFEIHLVHFGQYNSTGQHYIRRETFLSGQYVNVHNFRLNYIT